MGKVTRHVEGRTKDQRAKVRKNLGSLKQLTVQPETRARYEAARKKFYAFFQKKTYSYLVIVMTWMLSLLSISIGCG